jgi:Holliday junction DNA helicase RuvA
MIARITGELVEIGLTEIIVDVNGVGYQVFIPMSTYDKLPRAGEKTTLLIYTNVREDAIQLYGFATPEEKKLFELLITVNGIGARLALSILSSMPVNSFCASIIDRDIKAVKRINGVGAKTAERLIVELRDKVAKLFPESGLGTEVPGMTDEKARAVEDTLLALEQLGFKSEHARKVIKKIIEDTPDGECSSENLIRKALQSLNS